MMENLGISVLFVTRRGLFLLLCVSLYPVGSGCRRPPGDAENKTPIFLVSPQERQELQARLLSELVGNARRRCERPVLRGAATTGRSDPAFVALVEPAGVLAGCLAHVERHRDAIRQALFRGLDPRRVAHSLPTARSIFAPGAQLRGGALPGRADPSAVLAQVQSRCAGLPTSLERAVRHEASCSPYLPGRRRLPRLNQVLQVPVALAAIARRRALSGALREAAWLALHGLRFGQDLTRGGTAWIWPLVARIGMLDLVALLREIFASGQLTPAALRELQGGLARLAAGEPSVAAHFPGERIFTELKRYLLPLMPPDWVPPGGRPLPGKTENPPPRKRGAGADMRSGSRRQDLLVAWIAYRRHSLRLAAACQDASSGVQCLTAVRALERSNAERIGQLRQRWQQLSRSLSRLSKSFDRAAAREAAVEFLAGLTAPTTSRYLVQAAQRAFYVAALRIHVAALLGGTLSRDVVAALPEARQDPFARAPYRWKELPKGLEVRPAVDLAAEQGAVVRYVIPTLRPTRPPSP